MTFPHAASTSPPPPPSVALQPWRVALAGMAALAIVMGVGRFAFTPLLPMMLHDGLLTLAQGSWLATANYVGYLLGAIGCMALPWLGAGWAQRWHGARMVWLGLLGTVVLTLAMALPLPAAWWPALRFASGVAAAFTLLNVTAWCMVRLSALGKPAMASLIFCGPGLGIILTGLPTSAMVAAHWRASSGWLVYAVLAAVLCALVWPVVRGPAALQPVGAAAGASSAGAAAPVTTRVMHAVAYGLTGFGYIITATFLPVIARQTLPPGSPWVDWFWPIFGVGVVVGAALASRLPAHWDRRWLLMLACLLQSLGIAWSVVATSAGALAGSSWLVGLPFTVITFLGLQEARRQWPAAADSFASLVTVLYGLGQIAGPPLIAWLVAHTAAGQGMTWGLALASGALALAAVLSAFSAWRWPAGAAVRAFLR